MLFDKNLVPLLLVNVVIDVTYLISGIYTNISTFLYKKCGVGYNSLTKRND